MTDARAAKGEGRDEITAGSPQRMLAHAYALEQRQSAHDVRVRAGQALAPYQFPHDFWEAAHKGTWTAAGEYRALTSRSSKRFAYTS